MAVEIDATKHGGRAGSARPFSFAAIALTAIRANVRILRDSRAKIRPFPLKSVF
jgi:hypothetical protein